VINRYVFVPKMRANRANAITLIRLGTWSEVAVGAGVLTLVAIIGVLDQRLSTNKTIRQAHRETSLLPPKIGL
jgi:hypothetical protein